MILKFALLSIIPCLYALCSPHRALVALINEVKPGIAPDVSKLDPTRRQVNCNLAHQHCLQPPQDTQAHFGQQPL